MSETRFAIHSRVRLVEVTLDGLVDLTETRKVMGRLSRRQDLPRSFNLLISVARTACLSELTLPEFRRHRALTEGLHTFPGKGPRKTAIHCPDPLKQSAVQLWIMLTRQQAGADVQIKVFDTRKDALGWLTPPLDRDRDQLELELELSR